MDFLTIDKTDCLKAMSSDIDDFDDALLSVCAAKYKSKSSGVLVFTQRLFFYIVTRNTNGFANSKIKAITPDEFIALI